MLVVTRVCMCVSGGHDVVSGGYAHGRALTYTSLSQHDQHTCNHTPTPPTSPHPPHIRHLQFHLLFPQPPFSLLHTTPHRTTLPPLLSPCRPRLPPWSARSQPQSPRRPPSSSNSTVAASSVPCLAPRSRTLNFQRRQQNRSSGACGASWIRCCQKQRSSHPHRQLPGRGRGRRWSWGICATC